MDAFLQLLLRIFSDEFLSMLEQQNDSVHWPNNIQLSSTYPEETKSSAIGESKPAAARETRWELPNNIATKLPDDISTPKVQEMSSDWFSSSSSDEERADSHFQSSHSKS